MRSTRTASSAAILAVLLVACGSRVVPLSADQLGVQAPATGGPAGATGAPLEPGAVRGPGDVAASPDAADTTGGVLPGCVATKGTDVGVTATEVKVGLIAALTGPLPGQFNAGVEATDSYLRAVNDAGGVCGRKIKLLIRDDNGDQATNRKIAEQLAVEDRVFAFVGSISAPHDEGIGQVSRRYKIPDIGFPLSWERAGSPYTYGVPGQLNRHTIGTASSGTRYLNETHGIKRVALFWLNESEISIMNAWAFEASMKRVTNNRIEICHEQAAGVLDNNFQNYVVSMQGACGDPNEVAVYSTMENNANIKLAQAMADQDWRPKVFAPTFTSYLPSFLSQGGPAVEGTYIAMPQVPFERLQTPRDGWTEGTHELARYVETLKRYYPRHRPPGSFGAPGWGQAALFVETLKRCGAELTRACVLRELDAMGPFSANGLLSPVAPGARHMYTASLIVQVRGGRFVEIRPQDRSGPRGAPDFWDQGVLHRWQDYMCANADEFPNMAEKRKLLDAC